MKSNVPDSSTWPYYTNGEASSHRPSRPARHRTTGHPNRLPVEPPTPQPEPPASKRSVSNPLDAEPMPSQLRRYPFRRSFPSLLLVLCLGIGPALAAPPIPDPPKADQPKTAKPRLEILYDETYRDEGDDAARLDVYLPHPNPPENPHARNPRSDVPRSDDPPPANVHPAVLVIHGGGWTSGDKWTTARHCRSLAERGYVAVSINYRLAPEHQFPAQVDDVREALIWVLDNADRFAIDPSRIGIFGYSAGGHLATLVGMLADRPADQQQLTSRWSTDDPRWKRLPKILAICAGGPPCDFRELPPRNTMLAYFLGGSRGERPEIYEAASPTHHAASDAPAIQIIHGEKDLIVPTASSRSLYQALLACGADCRYELIPGQGHLLTFLHPVTEATMLGFFDELLQKPTPPNHPSP